MENFQIRSYGKSELALCYSPDITESAARRKLMRWIDRKPGLMGAMRAAGYNELSHTFLPLEVKLIVEVTDEFIKPIVHVENGKPVAVIEEGDVVIFFNYRNDRAKELTVVLTQQDMPEAGMHTIPGLQYFCMTLPFHYISAGEII